MVNDNLFEQLGETDLKIAGFQLWIHGREYADAQDYYDANWLRVTAHAGASGASVWVSGSILMVPDLAGFADQCELIYGGKAEKAQLAPLENELKLTVEVADQLGHQSVLVEITPDHITQGHSFEFDIDQTYLPEIVRQCRAIVAKYPIRGLSA